MYFCPFLQNRQFSHFLFAFLEIKPSERERKCYVLSLREASSWQIRQNHFDRVSSPVNLSFLLKSSPAWKGHAQESHFHIDVVVSLWRLNAKTFRCGTFSLNSHCFKKIIPENQLNCSVFHIYFCPERYLLHHMLDFTIL